MTADSMASSSGVDFPSSSYPPYDVSSFYPAQSAAVAAFVSGGRSEEVSDLKREERNHESFITREKINRRSLRESRGVLI